MEEFRLRRKSDWCAACQRTFEVGEPIYSCVVLEEDAPARVDRCSGCWEARDLSEEAYASWRTRHRAGDERPRPIDFRALSELFLRMAERKKPEYRKLTYLLALLLLRKRVLRLVTFVTERSSDWLVVERRPTGERLRVEAPELGQSEIAELRARLRRLLDLDLSAEEEGVGTGGQEALAPADR